MYDWKTPIRASEAYDRIDTVPVLIYTGIGGPNEDCQSVDLQVYRRFDDDGDITDAFTVWCSDNGHDADECDYELI